MRRVGGQVLSPVGHQFEVSAPLPCISVQRDVAEDIQSVKQFTSELIVEAVVRCLRVIDPPLGNGLSATLPPGMSARFRLGMSLAQACQDLGYKGEIGYQTFLYSNEPEIRSLLMFLVEKLPRESAEASDQPTGKLALLQKSIADQIKAQLAVSWVPPSCRLPFLCQTQVYLNYPVLLSFRFVTLVDILADGLFGFISFLFLCAPFPQKQVLYLTVNIVLYDGNFTFLLVSLMQDYRSRKRARLQKRILEQLRVAAQPCLDSQNAPRSGQDLAELLHSFGGASIGGNVLTKGTRFTHTEKFTFTQSPLQSVRISLGVLLSVSQVSDELKQWEASNMEKEASVRVKKQTVDLLPDAENNLAKLQALVESSAKRVASLSSQWEKHRAPLVEEHQRLKELSSSHELESSRKLSEIKDLHDKIRQSAEDAKKKEGLYKQLMKEFENLPKDVSRSAYTMRILEIVGNIKKQKEEITKILSDTKDLQKEINSLTGKLDRTFAVTDELVFKDAKKDESVRKSYKYLAALHENCTQLIQTIEDTGTIMREIRDLEEQIETENGKKTVSNLEKILEDYKAIRQENSALAAKIREA
uniref:Coiled-coil domain-containing protein 22 n=1 Tax=Scleropages formosus TaxID=113540 RepID=A0A8C9THY2_SCLFO